MSRAHHVDRVKEGVSTTRRPAPQIQTCYPRQHREHPALRLNARRVAVGAEQAPLLERSERAAISVLRHAVEDNVEPHWQDAREVFALIVDRRGAELTDQRRMRAARSAPQLETGQPTEHEQRLPDSAGGAMYKRALAWLHPCCAMEELIRGRPAQDQRGGLR